MNRTFDFLVLSLRSRYFHWITAFVLGVAIASGQTVVTHQAATHQMSAAEVTLQNGVLAGEYFDPAQKGVAFLGVPYAAPPVGDLRWKPPQPVHKWSGTRKATQFGSACPQLPANWFAYIGWNEDCLYLNVWATHFSPTAKLPVIVYFHGGSNTSGYSQMTPLGPTLSRMGVIVVSANYRLGPFGFLALPALTAESDHHSSGNYGLLDQLQALKWVHENIAQFGGNPSQVTVMGQSAGAVDICLLMSSPLAAGGLFQRAIMESGDCQSVYNEDIRTPIPYNLISGTGEAVGDRLAKDLGIADGSNHLRQLRRIPADKILKAWSQDRQVHFDAIVDGWVIPEQPAKIFASGKQLHIPVLVGSNANEATVFGHGGPKTVDEYKKYLFEDTGKHSGEEFRIYPVQSDADVQAQYLQLQSDSFAYGAYSMSRAMARVGQKAYLYYFTYAETGKRAALGAYHGEELQFLSDSMPADWEHTRDDEILGGELRSYWTRFAKTSNPNFRSIPYWSAYDTHSDQYFELGRKVGVHPIKSELYGLERIMNQVMASSH